MSLQLSPKAPTRTVTLGHDDARATAMRPVRTRRDECESPTFGVSCGDVLDEVRQRMASLGFTWE